MTALNPLVSHSHVQRIALSAAALALIAGLAACAPEPEVEPEP